MEAIDTVIKNKRLKTGKKHLLCQASLAVLYLWLILFLLDVAAISPVEWAVGASSLASSAFIVFVVPRVSAAEPIRILGGYVICVIVGSAGHFALQAIMPFSTIFGTHIFELITALSLGMSIVLMVLFKFQHPPAVGMTVILVLEHWGLASLSVIVFGVFVLIFLRVWFKDYLRNLT
jgi:hypothetical protein